MIYKNKFSFLTLLASLIFILLPAVAFGQGLVPCGNEGQNPCDFDYFLILIQSVINFLMFSVASPLAALMFAYAGFKLMTSGGNETAKEDAKKILSSVLFGLFIALSAWLVIRLIVGALLDPDYILLSLLSVGVV